MYSMSDAASNRQRQPVLIVEDHDVSRRALRMLLCESGFAACTASSAEEALAILERGQRPSIALIDLDLPGMDGAELLDHLRDTEPDVHVIMISGADIEHVRERVGFDTTCLRKPLDFTHLLAAIAEMRSDTHFASH